MDLRLPNDFKEFLRLLNNLSVEYLLVGGYAVGYHGYPRATNDMDIWLAVSVENAARVAAALQQFGFELPPDSNTLFLQEKTIVRLGLPPIRIELITTISGVAFQVCYQERVVDIIDGVEVSIISLKDLKLNKKASGRHKDWDDLEHLA